MAATETPSPTGARPVQQTGLPPEIESLENRYYAFLRQQGYSSSDSLHRVLSVYLPWFRGFQRVADLGCGHGEFMAQLREQGHIVSGVDVDPGMVAAARQAGFDVTQGDAIAWLKARPESLDAIFSSNVIEHLPPDTVSAWLRASYDALRPGGLLLFATPNPESAIVHLYEFWRDPTHVRLYDRQLLEFMLTDAGFERVQSRPNPASAWEGADHMLEGFTDPQASVTLPDLPAVVPDVPVTLAEGASWGKRSRWRLIQRLYGILTAPFLDPVRHTVIQHTSSLEQNQEALRQIVQRLQRLASAQRFLYPPREYYVLGYKPGATGEQHNTAPPLA